MSFAARYAGTCTSSNCQYDNSIREGDEVRYVGNEIMHDSCASVELRRNANEVDCVECGARHAGEC